MLPHVGLGGAAAAPGLPVCTIWFAVKLKIFQLGKKVFCENIWYVKYISIKLIKIEFD